MIDSMKRVLVCGGRDYGNYERVRIALEEINPGVVISGGARGADALAKKWAMDTGTPYIEMPAQWDVYGKAAGYIRNQTMIDWALPDLVLAFPGGRGTEDMMRRATNRKIHVRREFE